MVGANERQGYDPEDTVGTVPEESNLQSRGIAEALRTAMRSRSMMKELLATLEGKGILTAGEVEGIEARAEELTNAAVEELRGTTTTE